MTSALPADQIYAGEQVQLFLDGASVKDIAQGQLGDCWLISAIAAVAEYNQGLLGQQNFGGENTYTPGAPLTINLYDRVAKQWVGINVDDSFPVNEYGDPIFARSTAGPEAWVLFMEKAFAQLFGGDYSLLNGGLSYVAFHCLTGCDNVDLFFRTEDESVWRTGKMVTEPGAMGDSAYWPGQDQADVGTLWQYIHAADEAGELICAGTPGESDQQSSDGIPERHAYTIFRTAQVSEGTMLVCVRNPWANGTEWVGRFSDADLAQNNPQLLEQLGTGDADDGTFWMDINDFVRYFDMVCICNIQGGQPQIPSEGCHAEPVEGPPAQGAFADCVGCCCDDLCDFEYHKVQVHEDDTLASIAEREGLEDLDLLLELNPNVTSADEPLEVKYVLVPAHNDGECCHGDEGCGEEGHCEE